MATTKEIIKFSFCFMLALIYMPFWWVVIFLQTVCKILKIIMKWLQNLADSVTEIS